MTKYISQPMGVSVFPKELFMCPKDWAHLIGNLKFWKAHPVGGHFAGKQHLPLANVSKLQSAFEQPELLVQDLRTYFGKDGGASKALSVLSQPSKL